MQTINNEFRVRGIKRGRPTKNSQGNSVDLRRARGRKAQEAFRTRSKQYVRFLGERVSSIEDIIEQMSNTFMTFSDGILKSRVSQDLALIREVQGTRQRFLELSQRAVRGPDSENGIEPGNARTAGENIDEAQPSVLVQEEAFQGLLPSGTGENSDNYIISYIVAGRDSFASRFYFDTIVLALRSIRGEKLELADDMFGYKLRYVGRHKILEALGGILETLLRGTNQLLSKWDNCGKETSKEYELNIDAVKSTILRDTGTSENDYLDFFGVERYLKGTWSLAVDYRTLRRSPQGVLEIQPSSTSNLASTVFPVSQPYKDPTLYAPTLIAGFPQQEQVIHGVQSLLREITYAGVTIREGAPWAKAKVNAVVSLSCLGPIDFLIRGYTVDHKQTGYLQIQFKDGEIDGH